MSKWLSVIRKSKFRIDGRQIPRAVFVSGTSILNSIASRIEKLIYQRKIIRQEIATPLFIVGCWRSGTTFLQNILANDSRFGFPNLYQCLFPNHFLYTENILKPVFEKLVPHTRPQDNVHLSMGLPSEEEIAMCALTGMSHLIGDTMTMNVTSSYSKYITFDGLPNDEIKRWKKNFVYFLRKLSVRYQKPLVLKSPANTGRIRHLLELFPNAKFVMVHRHPHSVLRSGINWLKNTRRFWSLQESTNEDVEQIFVRNYALVMNAYFNDRSLIPEANLVEIGFDDLEQDPVSQISYIYRELGLQGFDSVHADFRTYVSSLENYHKNKIQFLAPESRQQIHDACPRVFEEWGYLTEKETRRQIVLHPSTRVAA